MANFCGNNGYSFPAPSVSSPIFSQFNGTNNMATTMHQHLVHFAPPSIRDNTALQAGTSDPVCSGGKWQEADSSSGVPWSSPSFNSGNVTPTTVWQHTVPSTMPWITPPMVHNTENMYTFNGLSSPPLPSGSPRKKVSRPPPACQRRCKRKCETSMEFGQEQPKEKIFVNEERMAARLEQLQIDNNNLDWHPNLEQETWYSQQRARPKSLQDLDERLSAVVEEDEGESSSSCESDSDNLPRLEMSELLKVGMKTKEILPKLIIDEMNKSAMQVVLWKPPERFISDVVKDISSDHLDKMDMADIEVTNPSGQPKVAEAVKPPQTIRSGVSTPIPDLLIEAAQMVNNNNTASSSSSQDPDVWHLMTSTPLPDTDLDFTFDDDDMDL